MDSKDLGLRIRINISYHSERYNFLIKWIRFEKLILLASTTTTLALLKSGTPELLAYIVAGLASLITISLIISGADESCNEHRIFYTRWNSLYQEYLKIDSEDQSRIEKNQKILDRYAEISAEQPPSPNASLLIYSQNKVLREIGSPFRIEQRPWRRMLRNVFDGDADNICPKYIKVG